MRTAPKHSDDTPVAAMAPAGTHAPSMDREFIVRNQIVERYIGGRLPAKGAQDFEHFCQTHPQLLEEINLTQRIHAALRLVEAGGLPLPWEQKPRKFWQKLPVLLASAALAVIFAVTSVVLFNRLSVQQRQVAVLRQQLVAQPLDPAKTTRTITVIPSRTAPSHENLVTVGGADAQMAELKFDVSWSQFPTFRVMIDRVDAGRVAVLYNVQRDSNGFVRIALNSSALGPGNYQFTLEGLNWRGEALPQAWATIGIAH